MRLHFPHAFFKSFLRYGYILAVQSSMYLFSSEFFAFDELGESPMSNLIDSARNFPLWKVNFLGASRHKSCEFFYDFPSRICKFAQRIAEIPTRARRNKSNSLPRALNSFDGTHLMRLRRHSRVSCAKPLISRLSWCIPRAYNSLSLKVVHYSSDNRCVQRRQKLDGPFRWGRRTGGGGGGSAEANREMGKRRNSTFSLFNFKRCVASHGSATYLGYI